MSNVVDLATIRAQRAEEEYQRTLQTLIDNLGDNNIYKPTPEDKYFELRLRDAVLGILHRRNMIDLQSQMSKTTTVSFVIVVDDPAMSPGSNDFYTVAEQIAAHVLHRVGYLHSVMIARHEAEWSVMLRYYKIENTLVGVK